MLRHDGVEGYQEGGKGTRRQVSWVPSAAPAGPMQDAGSWPGEFLVASASRALCTWTGKQEAVAVAQLERDAAGGLGGSLQGQEGLLALPPRLTDCCNPL